MNKIYQKFFPGKKNAGFTLIELLVVVLIIGILSAVALPRYQVSVRKSRLMTLAPLLKAMKDAEVVYFLANGKYAANPDDLDISLPAGAAISVHGAKANINLPNGSTLVSVAAAVPGVTPRIAGYWNDFSDLQIWLSYDENRWRCYGTSSEAKKVCRTFGCQEFDVAGGCDIRF